MNEFVDELLEYICLDHRIDDELFDFDNNVHMEVLRDVLSKRYNIDEQSVIEYSNYLVEKGKHPERQAYNKDGILVTFPTPEYKKRAIERGTHFEANPKVGQSNVFGGGQQAPQAPVPAPTTPQQEPPAAQPAAPAAPAEPAQGKLQSQPAAQQIPAVPSTVDVSPLEPKKEEPKKTPEQIEAEKEVSKNIMNSTDISSPLTEELHTLLKVATEMKLMKAVKFLVETIGK